MKNLLKNKKKLLLLSVLLLAFVAGCKSYVDPETKKVMEEYIIYTTTTFGEVMEDGRLTVPNDKTYRIKEAILLSKKLGRPLTEAEMKTFEL